MIFEFFTSSPSQTRKAGQLLAGEILKSPPAKRALVLGLIGDLGGGKTTFLQGLAQGLGIKQKVLSPTFIIMRRFPPAGEAGKNFYHLDCYRIQKPQELIDLGFQEIAAHPQNIVAIEWAGRVLKLLPKNAIMIKFEFISPKVRKLTLTAKTPLSICVKMKKYGKEKTAHYH